MRKIVSRLIAVICCLMCSNILLAQDNGQGTTTDMMLSNGKMYVVVAVCLTILICLFIYVFLLDRKISRLEKNKD